MHVLSFLTVVMGILAGISAAVLGFVGIGGIVTAFLIMAAVVAGVGWFAIGDLL